MQQKNYHHLDVIFGLQKDHRPVAKKTETRVAVRVPSMYFFDIFFRVMFCDCWASKYFFSLVYALYLHDVVLITNEVPLMRTYLVVPVTSFITKQEPCDPELEFMLSVVVALEVISSSEVGLVVPIPTKPAESRVMPEDVALKAPPRGVRRNLFKSESSVPRRHLEVFPVLKSM